MGTRGGGGTLCRTCRARRAISRPGIPPTRRRCRTMLLRTPSYFRTCNELANSSRTRTKSWKLYEITFSLLGYLTISQHEVHNVLWLEVYLNMRVHCDSCCENAAIPRLFHQKRWNVWRIPLNICDILHPFCKHGSRRFTKLGWKWNIEFGAL